MSEFADEIRWQADEAIRRFFQQEASPETDPIVELVGFMLENREGSISPMTSHLMTTDQWLAWNQVATDRTEELSRTVSEILNQERVKLPTEMAAIREWAVWLVQSTLDHLTMA